MKKLSLYLLGAITASSALADTAEDHYHSNFVASGLFIRSAEICHGEVEEAMPQGVRLLTMSPDSKQFADTHPERTKVWLYEGKSLFDESKSMEGILKACHLADLKLQDYGITVTANTISNSTPGSLPRARNLAAGRLN